MKMRIAVVALATAALLATTAAATAKPAAKKLGGTLKVVAWEGYTENQWVKPFEKQTGCTVQHQYAGSSDEMYNLMKKNAGYDLVSASGDAANRLIASGLVQAIDPKLIPDWSQLTPQLVKGPNQFVGGKHYGVPWQWGPNVLMWNTAKYKGATNSWSALYDREEQGPDHDPGQPDPDRRRGPLPVEDEALARHQGSLRADLHPAQRGGRPAQAAAPADQGPVGLRDRRGQDLPDRRSDARRRLAAGRRAAPARGRQGHLDDPEGRRDRLVGRLDAGLAPQEPALRAGLAEVRRGREGAGRGGQVQHLHAGQPPVLQDPRRHAVRVAARQRRQLLPQPHQVLEDAAERLRQRQDQLRAVLRVGQRVDLDQGLNDGR